MTVPKPASVADHEASHAVVWWWWWASQPEAHDPGTGREIWRITMEPAKGEEGHFRPNWPIFGNETKDERLCLEHVLAMALAGPISDELRNEPRSHTTIDEKYAKSVASQRLPSLAEATMFLEELRPRVRLFLERTEVRAMVKGLAEALLERKTLGHDEAVAAMGDSPT